jgi:hypothetical protein
LPFEADQTLRINKGASETTGKSGFALLLDPACLIASAAGTG